MAQNNHYDTLQVNSKATQAEIKQAYRRLAKQYHPDRQSESADAQQIVQINAAYEVLGDPQQRQSYDRQIKARSRSDEAVESPFDSSYRQQRAASAQNRYQKRQTGRDTEEQIHQWLDRIYKPVDRLLCRIIEPLVDEIDRLSADPFDDELLAAFQDYLNTCRDFLKQAQKLFHSLPNPSQVAPVAAHLYYCLNQIGDGLDELAFFPLNYDEHYLHTGQEMFRIALGLRHEARFALREIV